MIRTTFTAVPRRLPVLAAKAAIVGGLVVIVMMALAWAAFAIAEIVRGIHHRAIPLTDSGVTRSVAMAGVAMAALAVLGTGIGALVRQTVAAVIAFTAVVFLPLVLLTLPWRWADVIGQYGILATGYQLVSPTPHHDLPPVWAATLILIAWPLAFLIAATIILARRDA